MIYWVSKKIDLSWMVCGTFSFCSIKFVGYLGHILRLTVLKSNFLLVIYNACSTQLRQPTKMSMCIYTVSLVRIRTWSFEGPAASLPVHYLYSHRLTFEIRVEVCSKCHHWKWEYQNTKHCANTSNEFPESSDRNKIPIPYCSDSCNTPPSCIRDAREIRVTAFYVCIINGAGRQDYCYECEEHHHLKLFHTSAHSVP